MPRFGKMLALSQQHGLLPLTLALVSALSVPEVLVERGLAGDEAGQENKTPKHILTLR
jgi:ATP-dependent RNA helicase DHX37/DHR1